MKCTRCGAPTLLEGMCSDCLDYMDWYLKLYYEDGED